MTKFTNQQLKRLRVHSSFTKAFPVYKHLIKSYGIYVVTVGRSPWKENVVFFFLLMAIVFLHVTQFFRGENKTEERVIVVEPDFKMNTTNLNSKSLTAKKVSFGVFGSSFSKKIHNFSSLSV